MFQVEICSQQLEICKSVCMFIFLAIALWRLIKFRLFCSDDCWSWPREEKINNHGCWGKNTHIPDNDYWGIWLFHVVWTNFFWQLFYVVHTEYIFISIFIFHSGIRAIIPPKEFKSWVTCISFSPSAKSEKASNNKVCVIPL